MPSIPAEKDSVLDPLRSRAFIAVCANFVLILFGTAAVTPFISFYAIALGSTLAAVGVAVASLTVAAVITDAPTGILVESIGTRKMMVIGAVVSVTGGLLGSTIPILAVLLVSVFLIGAGQAMIMISNWVVVGQIAPPGKRGLYTTYYLLLTTVGIVLGSVAGGVVVDAFGVRAPFYLQFATAGTSLILTFLIIRDVAVKNPTRPTFDEAKRVFLSMLHRETLLVNLGWVIYGIISLGVISTAFPLQSKLELGLTATQIGLAIAVSRGVGLVSYAVTGPLYDKYSGKWLYVFGFLIVAIAMIGLGTARNFFQILGILAVFGFASSLISSSQIIFGVDNPSERRAMWIGMYRVFGDVGSLIGPLLVAAMIHSIGFGEMFEAIFVLSLSYSILLAFGLKHRNRQKGSR